MTIQIIGFYMSPYVLRIITVLHELGLSYELTQPASKEEIKTPEYLATKHPL